jgi:hypothetical protein
MPIMDRLVATNHEKSEGYGLDEHSLHAQQLIKSACKDARCGSLLPRRRHADERGRDLCPAAPWEGVICCHIGTHRRA